MNLLQIIIRDNEIRKVRCVLKKVDDIFVSGFEVSALNVGVFPRSIVQKLAFVMRLKLTSVRSFE